MPGSTQPARLGIDIGRVTIRRDDLLGPQGTKFVGSTLADAMKTPPKHDAFEVSEPRP